MSKLLPLVDESRNRGVAPLRRLRGTDGFYTGEVPPVPLCERNRVPLMKTPAAQYQQQRH